jgi:hypothetical protein
MKTTILLLTMALTVIIQPTTHAATIILPQSVSSSTGTESYPASSEPTSENWTDLSSGSLKTNVIVGDAGAKQSHILAIGKPKYNKRRITRQNMPGAVFRRGVRLQKKNGIGQLLPQAVEIQTGILTLNPLLA